MALAGDYRYQIVGGPGKWNMIVGFADHNLLTFRFKAIGRDFLEIGCVNAYVTSMSRLGDRENRFSIAGVIQTAGISEVHQSAHHLGSENVTFCCPDYDLARQDGIMTITVS